uniref:Putative secreted protein n=1 Tax=Amblyomma parvum TaxID=251391 RepID=A0A023G092_AMBPA
MPGQARSARSNASRNSSTASVSSPPELRWLFLCLLCASFKRGSIALPPLPSPLRGDAGDADLVGDAGGDCKLPSEEEESLPPMPPLLLLLLRLCCDKGSGDTAWLRSSLLGLLASGGELSPLWGRCHPGRGCTTTGMAKKMAAQGPC